MQKKLVLSTLGKMVIMIGISMLAPLLVSFIYQEETLWVFLLCAPLTIATGFVLYWGFKDERRMRPKDGYAIVTFGWIIASLFGALPYMLCDALPNFIDAFFETISGFTTTGATVLDDIEALPYGLLLWRSLTQWLGGVGIVVLFVAILSTSGVSGMQIFKAEMPGPISEKIRPRISDTAKRIWLIYILLTIVQLFLLMICGLNFFDAINHALTTTATGGFSTYNKSLGHFNSSAVEWITIVFMFLSGINFSLYYYAYQQKSLQSFFKNRVVQFYLGITVVATALIVLDLVRERAYPLGEAIRYSTFHVISVMTTTGFMTTDYELWPNLAICTLLMLMFVGGCAGSTSGGVKVDRWLILLSQAYHELKRGLHPRMITRLKINRAPVDDDTIISVAMFFFLYILICLVCTVFVASFGIDFFSAFAAVAATFGNVGPALGLFGPSESFSSAPQILKILFSFLMLLGRLEIYTVLVLCIPSLRRNKREN